MRAPPWRVCRGWCRRSAAGGSPGGSRSPSATAAPGGRGRIRTGNEPSRALSLLNAYGPRGGLPGTLKSPRRFVVRLLTQCECSARLRIF